MMQFAHTVSPIVAFVANNFLSRNIRAYVRTSALDF